MCVCARESTMLMYETHFKCNYMCCALDRFQPDPSGFHGFFHVGNKCTSVFSTVSQYLFKRKQMTCIFNLGLIQKPCLNPG